ncbi:MAG: tetraacyldisaccharide 4'-kinase [Bacteroidota bacterium]
MRWWQVMLYPFAILYDLITRFRNHLYNIQYKKSFRFEVPVVSVGNLSVGGTGKTPMITYLIEYFLNQERSIAILSRGYGRKTKGFRVCTTKDTPGTVGDEPFTYFEKFGDQVLVAVGEDRAMAIPFILAEQPTTEVILLDDAYQHRSVKPSFNVLLTTAKRPFWEDYVLPSGLLRESRKGASRSDAIIVTKSNEQTHYPSLEKLGKPYFQTAVSYGVPVFFHGNPTTTGQVVAVAGLADNRPFFNHVEAHYQVSLTLSFNDHHHYNEKDIAAILSKMEGCTLLTTHKDAVKLKTFSQLATVPCAFIPIKVTFLAEEERFLNMVEESLKDFSINQ